MIKRYKLKKWDHVNLTRFRAKCKVLHLGQGNHLVSIQAGDKEIEGSPKERDLGYWWIKSWRRASNVCSQSRKSMVSWATSKVV